MLERQLLVGIRPEDINDDPESFIDMLIWIL